MPIRCPMLSRAKCARRTCRLAFVLAMVGALAAAPSARSDHQRDEGWIYGGVGSESEARAYPCPAEATGEWSRTGPVVCIDKVAPAWDLEWTKEDESYSCGSSGAGMTGNCMFTIDMGTYVKVWGTRGIPMTKFTLTWLHSTSSPGQSSPPAGGGTGGGGPGSPSGPRPPAPPREPDAVAPIGSVDAIGTSDAGTSAGAGAVGADDVASGAVDASAVDDASPASPTVVAGRRFSKREPADDVPAWLALVALAGVAAAGVAVATRARG